MRSIKYNFLMRSNVRFPKQDAKFSWNTRTCALCHTLWTVIPHWTKCPNFTWAAVVSVLEKRLFFSQHLLFESYLLFDSDCWSAVLYFPSLSARAWFAHHASDVNAVFTTGCLGIVNNFEAAGVTYFLEAFAFWLFCGFCGFPDPFHGKAIFFQG